MKLPDRYYTPCTEPGTVEHIRYTSRAYALERFYGEECPPLEKSMYVYLPYGYDNSKNTMSSICCMAAQMMKDTGSGRGAFRRPTPGYIRMRGILPGTWQTI